MIKMCVVYTELKLCKRLEENVFSNIAGIVVGRVTRCGAQAHKASKFSIGARLNNVQTALHRWMAAHSDAFPRISTGRRVTPIYDYGNSR
jgi:hypothetical protein